MVIDVHVHPNGYPQVAQDPASRAFRDRVFQRRPQDALSAPIAMTGKPSGGNGGGLNGDSGQVQSGGAVVGGAEGDYHPIWRLGGFQ